MLKKSLRSGTEDRRRRLLATRDNNDFPEYPDEWVRRWPDEEVWFARRRLGRTGGWGWVVAVQYLAAGSVGGGGSVGVQDELPAQR